MNRFPLLVKRISKLKVNGEEIIRTHNALASGKPLSNYFDVYAQQEDRLEQFEKDMQKAIEEWDPQDLNSFWTGPS
tara:strand:- start:1362 stop:1589 length:228 start_codon:yes stop_codon:yes gene_type:complete